MKREQRSLKSLFIVSLRDSAAESTLDLAGLERNSETGARGRCQHGGEIKIALDPYLVAPYGIQRTSRGATLALSRCRSAGLYPRHPANKPKVDWKID